VSWGRVSRPVIAALDSSRKRSSLPRLFAQALIAAAALARAICLHLQGRQDLLSEERDVASAHGDDDVAGRAAAATVAATVEKSGR